MRRLIGVVFILAVALLATDCGSPAPAPTATPKPSAVPTSAAQQPTQPPAVTAKTAGELAVLGNAVYKRSCGRCHDDPFAGSLSNGLRRFNNAQEMLRFMQTQMPQDAPGSLPPEEYFYVLAEVMVDGQVVPAEAVLDSSKLADIAFQ